MRVTRCADQRACRAAPSEHTQCVKFECVWREGHRYEVKCQVKLVEFEEWDSESVKLPLLSHPVIYLIRACVSFCREPGLAGGGLARVRCAGPSVGTAVRDHTSRTRFDGSIFSYRCPEDHEHGAVLGRLGLARGVHRAPKHATIVGGYERRVDERRAAGCRSCPKHHGSETPRS